MKLAFSYVTLALVYIGTGICSGLEDTNNGAITVENQPLRDIAKETRHLQPTRKKLRRCLKRKVLKSPSTVSQQSPIRDATELKMETAQNTFGLKKCGMPGDKYSLKTLVGSEIRYCESVDEDQPKNQHLIQLKNGMHALVLEDSSTPFETFVLSFRVGTMHNECYKVLLDILDQLGPRSELFDESHLSSEVAGAEYPYDTTKAQGKYITLVFFKEESFHISFFQMLEAALSVDSGYTNSSTQAARMETSDKESTAGAHEHPELISRNTPDIKPEIMREIGKEGFTGVNMRILAMTKSQNITENIVNHFSGFKEGITLTEHGNQAIYDSYRYKEPYGMSNDPALMKNLTMKFTLPATKGLYKQGLFKFVRKFLGCGCILGTGHIGLGSYTRYGFKCSVHISGYQNSPSTLASTSLSLAILRKRSKSKS